ncbi:MAG: ankyrin repeat domain-containing protein [Raineya sp.]|jgi:hypothetical protein|nr:ankyrin repeat domain-containing protein [Raineya sp.]
MKFKSCSQIFTVIQIIFCFTLVSACQGKQKESKSVALEKTEKSATKPKVDLHTAVMKNDIESVKQHIAYGSDLNEKEPFGGSSPLIIACLFGRTEIAKLLINSKADLNLQNNDGSTPLIVAAFFCRPEIVKMLLDKNVNKNIKNKYGQTAYDSVKAPFSEVKQFYDMIGKSLEPMGLKLDYVYIEKTRPQIANTLK